MRREDIHSEARRSVLISPYRGDLETVATLIVQAERLFTDSDDDDGSRSYEWLFEPSTRDQITFHTHEAAVDDTWPEIDQLLDRSLAATIVEFIRNLG